ncbi:TraB/GumN family protein [Aurantibacter crassamenti]|uniref:TraB/GumN family protein n=1 Tax=Aurantibacter crassamenti TaxID=1837375 RepID=UPI001939BBC3|nr:TraB/GumN family protein [Aurantibacter crassamenti]MBM1105364.1 TraB/GumN family protein [Aurantibacter crassamenti]
MQKKITLVLLLFVAGLSAQSNDSNGYNSANSLLWEISGNGLTQSSYLYGTMHVSKRIAFRLDDVFYEALNKSEVVALESDPDTWLEKSDNYGGMGVGFNSSGFYTYPFVIKNPKKEEIGAYLSFEDRRVNNILYRTNENSQNFEEETYLDMFIYQAGKKFDKPVVALEDLEESAALVGRASLNAMKQKPDEWLQKKMQEQDPMSLLQDAYRNRNINLLDSIDNAMYTKHYLKNMLYTRNRNMANRLDSVMRISKVFTGIGAAHLPGESGVISMLQKMGYTVKPLTSKATQKGKRLKEMFETKIKQNGYKPTGPDDDFFTIDLPNKLYPVAEYSSTTYISPDLANGSFVMVNRIPTFKYLKQDDVFSLDAIDKLLFESIPGKIENKTRIKKNGFEGLDIKNKLKNGDHQRYQIFMTPLEIIIFKMGGDGDFVLQHSDTIFNSIKFRKPNKKQSTVASAFKDFEVTLPSLYNFKNRLRNGDRFIEGYDSISKSYYFLRKTTLNDFNFIEEDSFELKQIQKRFYQDLKLKPKYNEIHENSLTSKAAIDSVEQINIYLKTTFNRGDYYLMGLVSQNEKEVEPYFNSLKIKEPIYLDEFQTVQDTAMLFSTVSNVKPPKFVENSNNYYTGIEKPKHYESFNKKSIYQNKNNEAITVELNKAHDLMMLPSIDSLWSIRKKVHTYNKFNIYKEKDTTYADGYHELQLTLIDTASSRGILIKNIIKNGLAYELKAQVDTLQKPSKFVSEFFDNFKPIDTLIGKSIFADKTETFFKALRENDSIIFEAYDLISFKNKDVDSLKYYIENFKFKDDIKHIQSFLIQKLGKLNDPEGIDFFKKFYAKSYNNADAQTKILKSVTKNADANSVKVLLALLSQDLPLTNNRHEITQIFRPYMDSLPMAKKLYPELLDYSTIEEYKSPIFSLLARLVEKEIIKPKSYKKFRKQILNDAKIQLKRQLGKTNNFGNTSVSYAESRNVPNTILEDYAVLLFPFIDEKDMTQFYNRLLLVQNLRIKTTFLALLAKEELEMPAGMLNDIAQDINGRLFLFNKLKKINKLNLFPKAYRNEQAMAEASIYEYAYFDKKQDSIVFVDEKPLTYRGKAYTGYFFKTRNNQEYDKNFSMNLVVFEKGKPLSTKPFYKNSAMRIEDTETVKESVGFVIEEFQLKDRNRAEVYRPNGYGLYGYHGY